MRIYIAALYTSNFGLHGSIYNRLTEQEKLYRRSLPYILESYHYVHSQNNVDKMRRDGARIFLDSGAFSSFTQGTTINIDEYIAYIKRNQDLIEVCSVLDGIGDPLKTYQNQCYMESRGVRPLPCFHYGEDERYLEYYLANYEYITLGGMVPITTPQLKFWLDRIWEKYLTDGAGHPRVKVHGFGLTTLALMDRYPWYSVDSTSWQALGSVGNVLLPGKGIVSVSDSSPALKVAGRHTENIPEMQRDALVKEMTSRGFDYDRMKKHYFTRWVFNCVTYQEYAHNLTQTRTGFKMEQETLF